jgi:hypothetical protein
MRHIGKALQRWADMCTFLWCRAAAAAAAAEAGDKVRVAGAPGGHRRLHPPQVGGPGVPHQGNFNALPPRTAHMRQLMQGC